jgi:hypothetical protein
MKHSKSLSRIDSLRDKSSDRFTNKGTRRFYVSWEIGIVLILGITLSSTSVLGQTSLFSASTLTDAYLSSHQLTIKQSYLQHQLTSSLHLINLSSSSQIQQSPTISTQVPGDTTTYTFTAATLEAHPNGDFYWYGDLTGTSKYPGVDLSNDCLTGLLSITRKGSQVFGEMRIDTVFYQIPYLGDSLNALVKLNYSGNEPICTSEGSGGFNAEADSRDLCPVVRLLILYTQLAQDTFPDVENLAAQGFANTRQALKNSKITVDQLDVQLAGIVKLNDWEATGIFKNDAQALLAPHSEPWQLRLDYVADLVIILTPDVYSAEGFQGRVVTFGDNTNDRDSAYAVVKVEGTGGPYYVFTHEFGHLFGARHHRDVDCYTNHDNSGLQDAHAYVMEKGCNLFFNKRYNRTVVSPCYDNAQRITVLYYSNPYVEYNGEVTGVINHNYNARILRNAACRISSYMVSHDVNVYILAPDEVCPGTNFTVYGSVNGDYGPYTYHWKYKIGYAGSWVTVSGSPSSISVTAPTGFYGVIYFELTGTNGTDQAVYSTGTVSNWLCDHHRQASPSSLELSDGKTIKVSPNPTDDHLHVLLKDPVVGNAEVTVTSALGKLCFSTSVLLGDTPTNRFELGLLNNLPNGQYILTVRPANLPPQVVKFSIIR